MSLAVFLGGMGGTPVEDWMRRVLEATAFDTIEVAQRSGVVGEVAFVTDRAPTTAMPEDVWLHLERTGERFLFGAELLAAGRRLPAGPFAYLGAGSAPLIGESEVQALLATLERPRDDGGTSGRCVTNNRYSSDLFAVDSVECLALLDPVAIDDNAIPRRLRDEHGVDVRELPRTLATQFNIDTPSDALALAVSGRGGARVQAILDEPMAAVAIERMRTASREFVDRASEVLVTGRVSSRTWQYLETQTACRVRLLSEERGMHAAGTDESGAARSILGQWIGLAGPERAFRELLPELCRAAFIDIRPALVQLGLRPSRADRFAADLGLVDQIEDAGLRAIVAGVRDAGVPVILGGHTLVGGALELLNQWAWDERDRLSGDA